MRAHTTIVKPVRPQVPAAVILGEPAARRPVMTRKAAQAKKPTQVVPQALRQEAAKVREAVRRHYEQSYKNSWRHGEVNE